MLDFEPITQFVLECQTNPNEVRFVELGQRYSIKFDPLRESNKWTAIGPQGRIGDVENIQQAINGIIQDFERISLIVTKQIAFLDETVKFYEADPINLRGFNNLRDKCQYAPRNNSPGCAVGRHLPQDLAEKADLEKISIISLMSYTNFPSFLKELGYNFLASIQRFHDFDNYWSEKGLTYAGKEVLQNLIGKIQNFGYIPIV